MNDTARNPPGRVESEAPKRPGYRLPLSLMAIYWSYQLACRALGLDMMVLWLSRVAVAAVVYLTFLGWWLLSRRVARGDRWFALATVIVAGALVAGLSVNPTSALIGLPFVFAAWTIWLIAARRASPRAWRIGFASFIILTWAPFALLRVEGLTGDQREEVYWRWQPTAEQRFFAEH